MKNKNKIIIGVLIVFVVIGFIFLLVKLRSTANIQKVSNAQNLKIHSGENSFTLDRGGVASWDFATDHKSVIWDTGKADSFFDYIFLKYGVGEEFTITGEDELVQAVFAEGSGQGGGGSGGSGDISDFFTTPTPSGQGEGTGGSGSGGGTGGGSSGGGPSWCIHWKLSYCADPPAFSASPTPTPQPTGIATPLPPDCNNSGNRQTGKTVIGNELCLPSPTP